jgi:hypothetical protein
MMNDELMFSIKTLGFAVKRLAVVSDETQEIMIEITEILFNLRDSLKERGSK